MLGFFKVMENKEVFIKLQLPQSMKIHNIFYFNLFQNFLTDLLINQVNKLPLPVIINNKKEWEVKDILNTRSYQNKLLY